MARRFLGCRRLAARKGFFDDAEESVSPDLRDGEASASVDKSSNGSEGNGTSSKEGNGTSSKEDLLSVSDEAAAKSEYVSGINIYS